MVEWQLSGNGVQETVAKALEDGQCSNKNLRSRVEHLVDTIGEAKREEDPEMRKAYNKSKREYDKLYKGHQALRPPITASPHCCYSAQSSTTCALFTSRHINFCVFTLCSVVWAVREL